MRHIYFLFALIPFHLEALECGLFLLDHCMVNFIKENLLGSIKEFRNRFINPIQNGQCADSTLVDVRVMKKRAHILYEMLAGCVQVRTVYPLLITSFTFREGEELFLSHSDEITHRPVNF